jgi:hypothetical protein
MYDGPGMVLVVVLTVELLTPDREVVGRQQAGDHSSIDGPRSNRTVSAPSDTSVLLLGVPPGGPITDPGSRP